MQRILTNWNKEVSDLRARYPWLLFFSVPKMLLLHKLMSSSSQDEVKKVVHEVSFLIAEGRGNLEKKVEVSFRF